MTKPEPGPRLISAQGHSTSALGWILNLRSNSVRHLDLDLERIEHNAKCPLQYRNSVREMQA